MIATTSSEAQAARLRTLGADEVIDYQAEQPLGKVVIAHP